MPGVGWLLFVVFDEMSPCSFSVASMSNLPPHPHMCYTQEPIYIDLM